MNLSIAPLNVTLAHPLTGVSMPPAGRAPEAMTGAWAESVLARPFQGDIADSEQAPAQRDAQDESIPELPPVTGMVPPLASVIHEDVSGPDKWTGNDQKLDHDALEQWIKKRDQPPMSLSSLTQPSQPLAMANLLTLADGGPPQPATLPVPVTSNMQAPQNRAVALPASAQGDVMQVQRSDQGAESLQGAHTAFSAGASSSLIDSGTVPQEAAMGKPAGTGVGASAEQRLITALGDRISVQAGQGMQHAVIRLEPHMAGAIRIELTHEAGAMHVRITASQADVVQQLQAIGEGMRQELNSRQLNEVTVQIHHGRSAEHGDRGDRHQGRDGSEPEQPAPGRSWGTDLAEEGFEQTWQRASESRGYES